MNTTFGYNNSPLKSSYASQISLTTPFTEVNLPVDGNQNIQEACEYFQGQINAITSGAGNVTAFNSLTGSVVVNGINGITYTGITGNTGSLSLDSTYSPTFAGLTLSGLNNSGVVLVNNSGVMSRNDYSTSSTLNSFVVRDDDDGGFSAGTVSVDNLLVTDDIDSSLITGTLNIAPGVADTLNLSKSGGTLNFKNLTTAGIVTVNSSGTSSSSAFGSSSQVLTSTGSGLSWVNQSTLSVGTAAVATNATNASNVFIASKSDNTNYAMSFVSTSGATSTVNYQLSNFTYNPSTGLLSVPSQALSNFTGGFALYSASSTKQLTESAATSTELSYLSGVTSSIQTQLNGKQSTLTFPLSVSQGGTGASLSATGGASQVLQQTTIGGAITVGQLSAAALSNGTTGSGSVVLATSPTITSLSTNSVDNASSTLSLGSSATTTNIGNSSGTLNALGIFTTTDKLITLNKGGASSSGGTAGFEIEENGSITGYFESNSGRNGFIFKAPARQGTLSLFGATTNFNYNIAPGITSAERILTLPDADCVAVQGITASTSQFLTGVSSSTGLFTRAQPAFTDISGTAATTQGGTGLTTYTLGDIIYANASNSLNKLSGNTIATTYVLTQTGTGSVSAAPAWVDPATINIGIATNLAGGSLGSVPYQSASNTTSFLSGNTSATTSVLTQTGNGSVSAAPVWTSTTGSGNIVRATSPTLVSPTLGAATATSINQITITAASIGATLTIGDGKTATFNNTLTFSGTDSSSVAFGSGGTVAYTSNNLGVFASTTSSQLASVISDETGSGSLVFATSPTLVTPTLGVASATTINKVTVTTPATGSTLTIQDGFTLTVSGSSTINQSLTTSSSPSFSAVTATTFTGALSGNASTATTATNATNVAITNNTSSGSTYLAFMTGSSGNGGVNVDNLNLGYSPNAGTFRVGNSNNGTAVNNFTTSIYVNNAYGSGSTGVTNRFVAGGYNSGEVGLVANGASSAYNGIAANSQGIYCQDKDFYITSNGGSGSSYTSNFKFGNATPDFTAQTGNVVINTAGKGLKIKEGSNASLGASTLVGGTVTVSNTLVTATSRIMLTGQNSSGTPGEVYVSARSAGTSFTITSTQPLDTRLIAWQIIEPT